MVTRQAFRTACKAISISGERHGNDSSDPSVASLLVLVPSSGESLMDDEEEDVERALLSRLNADAEDGLEPSVPVVHKHNVQTRNIGRFMSLTGKATKESTRYWLRFPSCTASPSSLFFTK